MSQWETIGLVVVTWTFSAGLNWGILSERIKSIMFRIETLEEKDYITRQEYDRRHEELLEMIERKRIQ